MNLHKLLKHQLADYYAAGQSPSAELLDLFEMVSRTYEFYDEKLIRLEALHREQLNQMPVLKAC